MVQTGLLFFEFYGAIEADRSFAIRHLFLPPLDNNFSTLILLSMTKLLLHGPSFGVDYFLEGKIGAADVLLVFEFIKIFFILSMINFNSIKLTLFKFKVVFHTLLKLWVAVVLNHLSSTPQTFLVIFIDLVNDAEWTDEEYARKAFTFEIENQSFRRAFPNLLFEIS